MGIIALFSDIDDFLSVFEEWIKPKHFDPPTWEYAIRERYEQNKKQGHFYASDFNRPHFAVSILPCLMEFLQQIQQRYTHPFFLVWILHRSHSVRCLWYQASGNSETGMGLYYCLRTGASVLSSVFDARLYSW